MRRLWSRTAAVLLGAAVAGLVISTSWLGFLGWQNDAAADDFAEARQSARQMGVNLMTLDSKNAQENLDRIISGMTGDIKDEFSSQSKVWMEQVQSTKVQVAVDEVEAGVVSIDDDSAEVMVSLSSTVTNEKVKNGAARNYRYVMQMAKVDDRWLVSNLEMVP